MVHVQIKIAAGDCVGVLFLHMPRVDDIFKIDTSEKIAFTVAGNLSVFIGKRWRVVSIETETDQPLVNIVEA